MKKRNTFLFYLLTLLTGGQFGFLWLFLMAHDVEAVQKNQIPQLRFFSVVYPVVYVVYLVVLGYNLYNFPQFEPSGKGLPSFTFTPFLFFSAFFLLGYGIYLALRVADSVRRSGTKLVGNAGLILLFLFYLAALPLLQSKLNRAVESRA